CSLRRRHIRYAAEATSPGPAATCRAAIPPAIATSAAAAAPVSADAAPPPARAAGSAMRARSASTPVADSLIGRLAELVVPDFRRFEPAFEPAHPERGVDHGRRSG